MFRVRNICTGGIFGYRARDDQRTWLTPNKAFLEKAEFAGYLHQGDSTFVKQVVPKVMEFRIPKGFAIDKMIEDDWIQIMNHVEYDEVKLTEI